MLCFVTEVGPHVLCRPGVVERVPLIKVQGLSQSLESLLESIDTEILAYLNYISSILIVFLCYNPVTERCWLKDCRHMPRILVKSCSKFGPVRNQTESRCTDFIVVDRGRGGRDTRVGESQSLSDLFALAWL